MDKTLSLNIKGEIAETNQYGDGIRYAVILGDDEDCYIAGINEIFASIKENPFLDGVTFLGKEPFDSAQAVCALAEMLHEIKLNIIVDTSYTLENLLNKAKKDKDTYNLLKQTDILIDGTFEKSTDENEFSKGVIDMKTIEF